MGRFVGSIGHYGLCLWKALRYLVVYLVKGYTVMNIAGGHDSLQHKAVLVAGRMRFID